MHIASTGKSFSFSFGFVFGFGFGYGYGADCQLCCLVMFQQGQTTRK
jgi:hypothetical protein